MSILLLLTLSLSLSVLLSLSFPLCGLCGFVQWSWSWTAGSPEVKG